MSRKEIIKCWMWSDCLGEMHMDQAKLILTILEEDSDVDIGPILGANNSTNELVHPTVLAEARKTSQSLIDYRSYANDSATPMNEIL